MRLIAFTLHSWWGVLGYVVVITSLAVATSVCMLYFWPGPPSGPRQFTQAVVIAAVIAPPFGLFGGWHLLRITRLSEELANLVAWDRLSGAATREQFFDQLTVQNPRIGTTLMVDIDHFKRVNDTYGHMAGDAVICHVVDVLKLAVRDEDIVCRFGGEEFVIFLSQAESRLAEKVAERIRADVSAAILDWEGDGLRVTVSVGGAQMQTVDDLEAAMRRADACLYRAKQSGRDRCVMEWHETVCLAAI